MTGATASARLRASTWRGTRREGLAASLGLLLLGIVVFGPHVAEGGFYYDDWANSALTQHPGPSGVFGSYWELTAYRPLLVIYVPLTHVLFGESPALHLGWALALAVLMSSLLYAVLRALGIGALHAWLISALVLVFPYSDSTRLWATGSMVHLAGSFWLAGVLLALLGAERRARGAGRSTLLHAGAVALYLASILTYEITAPAVVLSGLLYRRHLGWRALLPRWSADLLATAAALAWVASQTNREIGSSGEQFDHARTIADQGFSLLAQSALPVGNVGRQTVVTALMAVAIGALVVWRLLPRGEDARPELGRWLAIAGAGVVAAGAGWAMFIPADPFYSPLTDNIGNRTNALAAVGIVMTVYACGALGATLLFRGLRNWRRMAAALSAAFALFLGVAYADDVRGDAEQWDIAAEREDRMLAAIERAIGKPRPGTTIYTFGHAGYQSPGIPIFAANWDLRGAVRLRWEDPSIAAYPILEGARMTCTSARVHPDGGGYGPVHGEDYGEAIFLDVTAGEAERIDSAAECRRASPNFAPGPVVG